MRPDRRELDADERAEEPGAHSGLYGRAAGALAAQLEREPVGDDLRAGVAFERRQRPVDRRKRAERAVAVERPQQPASSGFRSALARYRSSARESRTPRSRTSDESARSRRASSSRSAAASRSTPWRLSSRRRGSVDEATPSSRPAAASRARPRIRRIRPPAPRRHCRQRLMRPHAPPRSRSRDRASARRDVRRRQPPEPQALAPRPHRRQQHVGPRRHQHEGRRGRRLLERLQQRVLRFDQHSIRIVHDDDAPAAFEGTISGLVRSPRGSGRP